MLILTSSSPWTESPSTWYIWKVHLCWQDPSNVMCSPTMKSEKSRKPPLSVSKVSKSTFPNLSKHQLLGRRWQHRDTNWSLVISSSGYSWLKAECQSWTQFVDTGQDDINISSCAPVSQQIYLKLLFLHSCLLTQRENAP